MFLLVYVRVTLRIESYENITCLLCGHSRHVLCGHHRRRGYRKPVFASTEEMSSVTAEDMCSVAGDVERGTADGNRY